MTKYYFSENEKTLVRLMAQGLQDGSVQPSWVVLTGGDGIAAVHGANRELHREITEGRLQQAEFDNFVASGLLINTGHDRYTLRKQQIIEAVNNDFDDPIDIELEPVQRDLLLALVEAERNVSVAQRQPFYIETFLGQGDFIEHQGFSHGERIALLSDIQIFADIGLLTRLHRHNSGFTFSILPLGYKLYTQLKRRVGQPVERVVNTIRSYFDTREFQQKYPVAYAKWLDAENRLWGMDAEKQLTTVGHLCREAIQEFATALVEKFQPPNVKTDITKTVDRVRSVINLKKPQLGDAKEAFLIVLLAYWGTVIDLVQRQEHGGQKEGDPLVLEDGRRVVFQTAMVMFEIDRALSR